MHNGIKVKIGDEILTLPAISLGQLRGGVLELCQQHDKLISEGKTFEAMEIRGKVIYTALTRNYPNYDENKLFEYLDLQNIGKLWLQIMGVSGFDVGEEQAAETLEKSGT